MLTVIVAGGGIGGLAAALAIAGAGHQAVVLEREGEFAELGAGIQLAPNAFAALDRLGAGEQVRAGAVRIEALVLKDGATGRELTRLGLGAEFRRRFGNPYAVVHRVDLYRALLDRCRDEPRVELRSDNGVTGYVQDEYGVSVRLGQSVQILGDALIGADGLRSTVRAQLAGDGDPAVSGHTTYRAVLPVESLPVELRTNTATLWAAPGSHVVHYPIAGGRLVNLVATRDDGAGEPFAGKPVDRAAVLAEFAHFHDRVRRLLGLAEDWRAWVLCDREPSRRWTDGRVALLGDAAHPMLQYAAQGACMALEDAVELGVSLSQPRVDPATALSRYAAARIDRTARVQELSRWLGREIFHPGDGKARYRDEVLATMTESDLRDRVAWLYGGAGVSSPAAQILVEPLSEWSRT